MRKRLPLYDAFRERLRIVKPSARVSPQSVGRALPAGPTVAGPTNGAAFRVFNQGAEAFGEIMQRVEQAEKSIEVRAFLWRDDEVGNRLGAAILDAAERGVSIIIHKDRIAAVYEYMGGNKQSFFHKRINPTQRLQAWFLGTVYRAKGSFKQKPNALAEAILGHPNITVHHKRKRFDHSKLFIFDEEIITLGSMGIGDNHHREWVDVMVEIQGADHVARLRQRLASEQPFDPGLDIDFLVHSRDAARRRQCSMLAERLALIEAAERSLTVEMAYLGDPRFTKVLLRAIKRGVDVKLVTAAQADVLGNLNRATCNKLMQRTGAPENLTIVFLPRMVHSKIVVVDGAICDVGSANFTPLSHGVYNEINLYAVDPDLATALQHVVDDHCLEGEEVEGRIGYRRLHSGVERVIVAYQSRKGGKLPWRVAKKGGRQGERRREERRRRREERRLRRGLRRRPLLLLPAPRSPGAEAGIEPAALRGVGPESTDVDGVVDARVEKLARKRLRKLARKRARRLARIQRKAESKARGKSGLLWRGRKGSNRSRTRP